MIETNPGPGLGILLAFRFAGPRDVRPTVPGAAIIHFFGGIHEIYFPYVLMKPFTVIAAILGGAAGVLTFLITGVGLVATPSPGSIFAYMAVTPRGNYLGVILGVLVAAAVSFVSAAFILKVTGEKTTATDIEEAQAQSRANKNIEARPQGA
jgi:PTS system mannitol-specific IIC component